MSGSSVKRACRLMEELERKLQPLSTREALAYWKMATSASSGAREEYVEARTRLRCFLSQKELFDEISALRDRVGQEADEFVRRQLDIAYSLLVPNQVAPELIDRQVRLEAEIEALHAQFRAHVDGESLSQNDLDAILRHELDPTLRRAAWEAGKEIGREVAPVLLQLVDARNEGARCLGFADYYSMSFAAAELREDVVYSLLAELEKASSGPFRERKARLDEELARRFAVQLGELKPWHYGDPFFQEAPPVDLDLDPIFAECDLVRMATEYFDAIGLRVEKVIAHSDLYERPGKAENAFCLDVDAAGDVRILCNLRPTERGARKLLHELGHAVYNLNIAKEFPYLLRRPAHSSTTEAAAFLFERMVYDEQWLAEWADVPSKEAREIAARARAHAGLAQAIFLRWGLVMVHFERALYRERESDLNELWWRLVERFQGVSRPEGRDAPDWAAKVHLGVAPVYYQNYLLGEVLAAQLSEMVEADLGEGALAMSPAAGYLLIDRWFAHGARFPWGELAEMAFGKPLDADAYIERYFSS